MASRRYPQPRPANPPVPAAAASPAWLNASRARVMLSGEALCVSADRQGAHRGTCQLETILLTAAVTLGACLPAAGASTAAQAARTAGRGSAVPVFPGALGGVSASSRTDAWAVGAQSG